MKNVFVKLTEVRGRYEFNEPVWINMSRVQEIRPLRHRGQQRVTSGSVLKMNIPNYEVQVIEKPDEVIQKLLAINMENEQVISTGGLSDNEIAEKLGRAVSGDKS